MEGLSVRRTAGRASRSMGRREIKECQTRGKELETAGVSSRRNQRA